jgi:hypothetical protein
LDPAAVAQRVGDRLAEREGDVLDGVVLVDMEVAGRRHRRSSCRGTRTM